MAHRIHSYVFNRIFLVDTEDTWAVRSGPWCGWLAVLLSKQSDYSHPGQPGELHLQIPSSYLFKLPAGPPVLQYSFSPLWGLFPQSTLGSPKALAALPRHAPDFSLSSSLTP